MSGQTQGIPRALAILKYAPAVLCGLLLVAWVVSLAVSCRLEFPVRCSSYACDLALSITRGKIQWVYSRSATAWGCITSSQGSLPLLAPITALLPFALGCLTRFRFPLWSYFAWTALIAAELAYYLR